MYMLCICYTKVRKCYITDEFQMNILKNTLKFKKIYNLNAKYVTPPPKKKRKTSLPGALPPSLILLLDFEYAAMVLDINTQEKIQ